MRLAVPANVSCAVLCALGPVCGAEESRNTVLGTQTIGVKYQFTSKSKLVETAERIREMGSNLLKISLSRKYCGDHYGLPRRDDVKSLADLAANEPSVRAVLDMPFTFYHFWAYGFANVRWQDGLSAAEEATEYRELYDLVRHLLTRCSGSGKAFYIGHWEGDWHLHPGFRRTVTPAPAAVQGMIDWLNIRQKAVDDAKRETPHAGVQVYHYTEVNLVDKAMKGGTCLTNDVLPHTNVDFVSYSAYDIIGRGKAKSVAAHQERIRERLPKALDTIESRLPAKPGIDGKRVFIGEYGFPLSVVKTPEAQDALSRTVAQIGLEWGCPFALYWELYCNEIKDGKHRGFWLIDEQDRKQPFYHTLRNYYGRAEELVAEFAEEHGRPPSDREFRRIAVNALQEQ